MRDGRDNPRAPNLECNIFDRGRHLLCGKFKSDREPGRFSRVSEHILIFFLVHFYDDAVDKIFLARSARLPLLPIRENIVYRLCMKKIPVYLKSKRAQSLKLFKLRFRKALLRRREVIHKIIKATRRGDLWVKLAYGSRSGVPWIRKKRLTFFSPRAINALKLSFAEPHFPFDNRINRFRKSERHRFYRLDVRCHVLADNSVAASGRGFEDAFFVCRDDFEPVDFELARICRRCFFPEPFAQKFPDPRIEITRVILGKRIIKRPLRHRMPHFFERRKRFTRNALGWGIRRAERGVLLFKLHELVLERIEGACRNLFFILHVIQIPVALYRLPQFLRADLYFLGNLFLHT